MKFVCEFSSLTRFWIMGINSEWGMKHNYWDGLFLENVDNVSSQYIGDHSFRMTLHEIELILHRNREVTTGKWPETCSTASSWQTSGWPCVFRSRKQPQRHRMPSVLGSIIPLAEFNLTHGLMCLNPKRPLSAVSRCLSILFPIGIAHFIHWGKNCSQVDTENKSNSLA